MFERHEYLAGELNEADLNASPAETLNRWLKEAEERGVREASAMCVSTVGENGRPSARFVLLRSVDESGLTFGTNYESRKGTELAGNPFACATFWWAEMERQVRVEGRVEKVTEAESDEFFASRPRGSQIASAASRQSHPLESREKLVSEVAELTSQVGDGPVPRPDRWGGYRLVPDRFEFWQGRAARLHDRLVFTKDNEDWSISRLYP